MREFYKGKENIEEVKMEKMIMVIVGIFIFCNSLQVMAIPVVEFSREGYKIRKIFG